jgi:TolB protein
MDRQPVWSPDGRQLAFVSNRRGRPRIFVMNADGSTPRALRTATDTELVAESDPSFSPDGRLLTFVTQREGRSNIVVTRVADGVVVGATEGPAFEQRPSFSPDGERVVFSSNRDDGDQDVYSMAIDGTGLRRLTQHGSADWLPRWHPSTKRLSYTSLH